MKKLFLLLPFLFLIMTGLSWDGELDPTAFDRWKVIRVIVLNTLRVSMVVENPDTDSPIRLVRLVVKRRTSNYIDYRYFKNREPYIFSYNKQRDRFIRVKLPEDARKACKRCHLKREKRGMRITMLRNREDVYKTLRRFRREK